MDDNITNLDITLEDLKKLSPEELVELKMQLEELLLDYEELLEDNDE